MCPVCETKLKLLNTKIETNYNGKEIKVDKVPLYHCNCTACNFSREVRIKIKQKLRVAFNNNLSEIDF